MFPFLTLSTFLFSFCDSPVHWPLGSMSFKLLGMAGFINIGRGFLLLKSPTWSGRPSNWWERYTEGCCHLSSSSHLNIQCNDCSWQEVKLVSQSVWIETCRYAVLCRSTAFLMKHENDCWASWFSILWQHSFLCCPLCNNIILLFVGHVLDF